MSGASETAIGAPRAACEHERGCITCGDVALLRTVLRLDGQSGLALCEDGEGRREQVEVSLIDAPAAGETLLVHAGVAIARVEREASTATESLS